MNRDGERGRKDMEMEANSLSEGGKHADGIVCLQIGVNLGKTMTRTGCKKA